MRIPLVPALMLSMVGAGLAQPRPAPAISARPGRGGRAARWLLAAAPRGQSRGHDSAHHAAERRDRPRCQLRSCCAPRDRRLRRPPVQRHGRLQGDRSRVVYAPPSSQPHPREAARRADCADRRRAGTRRLSLPGAHHQSEGSGARRGTGAMGASEWQPRALQRRASLRGGGRALLKHRQANAARCRDQERRSRALGLRSWQAARCSRAPGDRARARAPRRSEREPRVYPTRGVVSRRARQGAPDRAVPRWSVRDVQRPRIPAGSSAGRRSGPRGRSRRARDLHVRRHGRRRAARRSPGVSHDARGAVSTTSSASGCTSPAVSARAAAPNRSATTTSCPVERPTPKPARRSVSSSGQCGCSASPARPAISTSPSSCSTTARSPASRRQAIASSIRTRSPPTARSLAAPTSTSPAAPPISRAHWRRCPDSCTRQKVRRST